MSALSSASNFKGAEVASGRRYVCQYTTMATIGREANRTAKSLRSMLKLWPKIKRRLRRYMSRLNTIGFFRKAKTTRLQDTYAPKLGVDIQPGDFVRVLPYAEIKATLNPAGYCKGLQFQNTMRKYCGGTYKVDKTPAYLLEECGKKISKCRDLLILHGLTCDGIGEIDGYPCDRCCFHYWKKDWLEKIE